MPGVLGAIAVLLAATPASANVNCTGQISEIIQYKDGRVYVEYGYGTHRICTIGATYGSITPEGCQSLLSMFLTLRAQGAPLTVTYDDTMGSCSNIGNWVSPNPPPLLFRVGD